MFMQAVRQIVDILEDMRYSQVKVMELPFATVSRSGVAYFSFKMKIETMITGE
jgi:hypothetical protein